MSDQPTHDFDDTSAARGGLHGRHLAWIGLVTVAVLAVVVWWMTRPGGEPGTSQAPAPVESVPEGSRNVTLYFADADEPAVVAETRELAVGRRLDEQVRQVVDALIAGPSAPKGISAIPAGTHLLSVMVDADSSRDGKISLEEFAALMRGGAR